MWHKACLHPSGKQPGWGKHVKCGIAGWGTAVRGGMGWERVVLWVAQSREGVGTGLGKLSHLLSPSPARLVLPALLRFAAASSSYWGSCCLLKSKGN